MRAAPLALLLMTAACGEADEASANLSAGQIERLATASEEKADPLAAVRIEPIAPEELAREGLNGGGCAFTREGRLLLAAAGSNAVVRIGGEIRHLVQTSPAGPSGGFFEDRQLSVSVGRTDLAGAATGDAAGWPARLRVGHRRGEVEREWLGVWTCGA